LFRLDPFGFPPNHPWVQRWTILVVRLDPFGFLPNHPLMLHPWMSKGKNKKSKTKQPKLSNVAPMDERGENQKSLNETNKIV
jgi:hypothetical protein